MKDWRVLGYLAFMVVCAVGSTAGAADKGKPQPGKSAAPSKGKDAKPAEQPAAEQPADKEPAEETAPETPPLPSVLGPKKVSLGHQSEIDLPAGMRLFERAQAQEILRRAGDDPENVIAAIEPVADEATWVVFIEAEDVGYVTDSDADDLDAAALLDDYKKGTAEQNKQRVAMGSLPIYVDGWSEPPRYERTKHQLVWGLNGHTDHGKSVNFFTRLLGRNGYLSVDLIDAADKIESSKQEALVVLTALHFGAGSRYEDHTDDDKSSGMGLKALVVGGAGVVIAKKTGLLVGLLIVLKKGIIFVAAAIAGFFKWLFGRRKKDGSDVIASDSSGDPGAPGG